jgi:hypothetical protein
MLGAIEAPTIAAPPAPAEEEEATKAPAEDDGPVSIDPEDVIEDDAAPAAPEEEAARSAVDEAFGDLAGEDAPGSL